MRTLVGQKPRPPKLSQPALETLSIIAYRQPLTRAEGEQIRGVSVDGVVQTLLERGLIEKRGRAEVIGRPMTYGTTPQFLEYFGLKSLNDLPAAPELLRIVVERPEALQTVETELETVSDETEDSGANSTDPGEGEPANHEPDESGSTETPKVDEAADSESQAEPANDAEESQASE